MRRAQTLAVLLVAALVIAIGVALVYFNRQMTATHGTTAPAPTTLGAAMQRAKEVECLNNLRQLRAAVQQYRAVNETNPPNLQDLRGGVPPVCPVTQVPYTYDPATGTVRCPRHPNL
ncbi:hypothetical protein HRbin17_00442 [bacterium HR17]|jgi:hypothetical protein|uniref:Type II secretion system protein G n=1 Tax=Candidatus Fervidibacter japonicus TaxID=2035412 RepID=A0A2H5XA05_9BACT|nr:hypothetical protein HRbin17_00442 [bacterium HR17]